MIHSHRDDALPASLRPPRGEGGRFPGLGLGPAAPRLLRRKLSGHARADSAAGQCAECCWQGGWWDLCDGQIRTPRSAESAFCPRRPPPHRLAEPRLNFCPCVAINVAQTALARRSASQTRAAGSTPSPRTPTASRSCAATTRARESRHPRPGYEQDRLARSSCSASALQAQVRSHMS